MLQLLLVMKPKFTYKILHNSFGSMMLKLSSSYSDPWCLEGSFPPNPTKLFAPPSPINITTTARYNKQFTPTRNLSGQTSSADLSPGQNKSPHLHRHTIQ